MKVPATMSAAETRPALIIIFYLVKLAERGMRLSADRVWKVWERPVLDPRGPPAAKMSSAPTAAEILPLVEPTQLIFSLIHGGRYTRDHAQKAECEGVSESVNPLPSFRQASSI